MDFYTTAESIKLSAAEKETIKSAQAKIKSAESISACYGGEGSCGERCFNQLAIADLAEKFKTAPTAELASEIAKHAMLHESSKAISGHLGGIVTALREEISKEMLPLAEALTGRVIAELDKQLAAAEAGLAKISGMADAAADIRARHRRQVEIGTFDVAELAETHRDTLQWLAGTFEIA